MIVWAGTYYTDHWIYISTGGRYNPAMDDWTPTSLVYSQRSNHTAVWTGREMIAWGGYRDEYLNSIARYCICGTDTVDLWYADADGDGYGVGSTGVPSCAQPAGYVEMGGDCNDANADIYSDAMELNDGLDNQCPGDAGYGIIDEISGTSGFHNTGDSNEFSWTAQAGATAYEVARSTTPQFAVDCLVVVTGGTSWIDTEPVPEGVCYHYLVRPLQPNAGLPLTATAPQLAPRPAWPAHAGRFRVILSPNPWRGSMSESKWGGELSSIISREFSGVPLVLLAAVILVTVSAPAFAGVCVGLDGGPGDLDGDGFVSAADCDDGDPAQWSLPGEARNLTLQADKATLVWDAVADPGGSVPLTHNLYRSDSPVFSSTDCHDPVVELTSTTDSEIPSSGDAFYYLVQGQSDCGGGSVGNASAGFVRDPLVCDCSVLCDDGDACTTDRCSNGACVNDPIAPLLFGGPSNSATCAGGIANLKVLASGSGSLSYQWFVGGAAAGTNDPVLMLSGLSAADNGLQISVEVTDACSSATSAAATLTVFADPNSCAGGLDGLEPTNGAGEPMFIKAKEQAHRSKAGAFAARSDVRLHSGEFVRQVVDLSIPGRGFDFVWSRSYRSRTRFDGSMGPQWTHGYDRFVRLDAGSLIVHDGSTARVDAFFPSPVVPDCWEREGFFRQVCLQPDGRYVMLLADKREWIFRPLDGTPSEGKIEAVVDRNQNAVSFNYDPSGRLDTVVDTLGRPIVLGYGPAGLLETVTDFSGREVRYEYYGALDLQGAAGDLRSATGPAVSGTPTGNDFPQGRTEVYTYSSGFADDTLNHNLLTITDPQGQTYLENVYGATDVPTDSYYDRLYQQILPEGSLSYTYAIFPPDPLAPAASSTIVNDRMGNVTRFDYDSLHRLLRGRRFSGRAADPSLPTGVASNLPVGPLRASDPPFFDTICQHNADNLVTDLLRPNQDQVQYQYDSFHADPRLRGNLLQRTRFPGPLGGDQQSIVESWTYATDFGTPDQDPGAVMRAPRVRPLVKNVMLMNFLTRESLPPGPPLSFPASYTDGRGQTYSYGHDQNGNLRTVQSPLVVTGTPGGAPQTVLRTYDYNPFGQLTGQTSPEGRLDQYAYYTTGPQNGYLRDVILDQPREALLTTFEYDAVGNVTRVTDPRGNDTQIQLNSLNEVVRIVSSPPFGYETDFYYDANGNNYRVDLQVIDDAGLPEANVYFSTTQAYDALDRLVRVQDEVDTGGVCVVDEYEYDANDNATLRRKGEATSGDQPDNVVRHLYDERDLLFQVTRAPGDPDASTTAFDYDGNSNVIAVREGLEDPAGSRDATRIYDGYDRLTAEVDPLGNTTSRTYDANDRAVVVRVDGEETQGAGLPAVRLSQVDLLRDEINRVVQTDEQHFVTGSMPSIPIGDGVSTTRFLHAADDRLVRVEDDNGHGTDLLYDSVRRLQVTTDTLGNSALYGYDRNSNVTSVTEEEFSDLGSPPESFTTTQLYDELDRRVLTIDNAGQQWEWAYDSRNNSRLHLDSLGNATRFEYDGLDRRVRETSELTDDGTGAGNLTGTIVRRLEWDDSSRLVVRVDDNGNETRYAYDALDRHVRTTYADGTQNLSLFDVHDDEVRVTDPNGSVMDNTYDALDRLLTRAITPAPGVLGTLAESYEYDGLSRLRRAEDDDSVVTLTYDSLSNVTEESLSISGGAARVTGSTHDGVGNVLTLTYPSGYFVSTTHDPLDRRKLIFGGGSVVAGYQYFGTQRTERIDRPLGFRTTYVYDSLRRVTRVLSDDTVTTLADHLLSYDPMDNETSRSESFPGSSLREWTYDSAYRLVQSRLTAGTTTTIDYLLDGVGNRLSVTGGPDAGLYTLDPTLPDPADAQLNQYSSTPLGPRSNDRDGNLLLFGGYGGARSADYDYRDQMVRTVDGVGASHTYAYDALGRRVEKVDGVSGQAQRYYYDGWRVVEEQDAGGAATATYIYGNGIDELLQMDEAQDLNGNLALDRYSIFMDNMHVVLAQDTLTGAVVESYEYDDFGAPRVFDASGTLVPESVIRNPYRFAGRRYDEESGLYYYRTRYLDPHAGRFTTRDSIGLWGDGGNLGNGYTFVGNNPWSGSDPFGMMNKAELIDAIAGDANLSKADSKRALETLTSNVVRGLKKGDKVALIGFGSFSISNREARTGRNPQTGATIQIKARIKPKNKAELIDAIAGDANLSKADSKRALEALTGFGTFSISNRSARTGRNPQTGATIQIKPQIKPKKKAKFKAGKALAETVK